MMIAWATDPSRMGETEFSDSTVGLAVRVDGLTGLLTDFEMIGHHRRGERCGLTVGYMGLPHFAWKCSDFADTHLPTRHPRLPRLRPRRPSHLHPRPRPRPRPHPKHRRRPRRCR